MYGPLGANRPTLDGVNRFTIVQDRGARAAMPTSTHVQVVLALVSVQLSFAGWHVLGKWALDAGAHPLVFALVREGFASVSMLVLAALMERRTKLRKEDVPTFVLLGLLIFLNVALFVVGLSKISAVNASVLQPSIPVFAMAVALVMRWERPSWSKIGGIFLASAGAACMSVIQARLEDQAKKDGGSGSNKEDPAGENIQVLVGNIMIIVQCWAIATLLVVQGRYTAKKYPSITQTAWYYSIGTLFTIAVCIGYFWPPSKLWHEITLIFSSRPAVIALVYATLAATVYNYTAISWANKHAPATLVSLASTLQPVLVSVLSVVFLGVGVSWAEAAFGLVIAAGLVLSVYGRQRAGKGHEAVGPDNESLGERLIAED